MTLIALIRQAHFAVDRCSAPSSGYSEWVQNSAQANLQYRRIRLFVFIKPIATEFMLALAKRYHRDGTEYRWKGSW